MLNSAGNNSFSDLVSVYLKVFNHLTWNFFYIFWRHTVSFKFLIELSPMCYLDKTSYRPSHKILVLIEHGQLPLKNTYPDVSSKARGLFLGQSLHLHPYFVYASSEGPGNSASTCLSLYCSPV